MLTVTTFIAPSAIHGIGLFAGEFIPKGTKVWEFTPNFDFKYTEQEINNFPEKIQDYIKEYGWLSKKSGKYCFSSDNGKFFNHSKENNVQSYYFEEHEEVVTLALRDIQIGEELLDDYSSFEEGFADNFFGNTNVQLQNMSKQKSCWPLFHKYEIVGTQTAQNLAGGWSGAPLQRVVRKCKKCGKISFVGLEIGVGINVYLDESNDWRPKLNY